MDKTQNVYYIEGRGVDVKIGTIVLNHWAGEGNPSKYFIYTGIKGKYATGIFLNNGKLETANYYKKDLLDSGKFEPVGYCNGFDIMKEDLKSILD